SVSRRRTVNFCVVPRARRVSTFVRALHSSDRSLESPVLNPGYAPHPDVRPEGKQPWMTRWALAVNRRPCNIVVVVRWAHDGQAKDTGRPDNIYLEFPSATGAAAQTCRAASVGIQRYDVEVESASCAVGALSVRHDSGRAAPVAMGVQ